MYISKKRVPAHYLDADAGCRLIGVIVDADVAGKGFAQEDVAKILRKDEQGTDGHGDAAGVTADISLHQLQKCVA